MQLDIIVYCVLGGAVVMGLAWWCGRNMGPDHVAVGEAVLLLPANRLEELLIEAVDSDGTPELTAEIKRSTLTVLCGPEGAIAPMKFTFPPEFADGSDDAVVNEDGQLERGPLVFCFSSQAMADQLRRDSVLGDLLLSAGGMFEMRQHPARDVFAFALSEDLTVRLNAFGGVGRNFTGEELQELSKAD